MFDHIFIWRPIPHIRPLYCKEYYNPLGKYVMVWLFMEVYFTLQKLYEFYQQMIFKPEVYVQCFLCIYNNCILCQSMTCGLICDVHLYSDCCQLYLIKISSNVENFGRQAFTYRIIKNQLMAWILAHYYCSLCNSCPSDIDDYVKVGAYFLCNFLIN